MISKALSVISTVTVLVCVVQGYVHKLDPKLKEEYGLQPAELEAYKRAFGTFDNNNDLYITSSEVAATLKVFGQQVEENQLSSLRLNDHNGDGKIDLDEFIFMSRKDANVDFVFKKTFANIDSNNSGTICAEELQNWLKSLGKSFTLELAEKYLQMADGSQDGHLTYLEVLSLLDTLTHGPLKP